MIPKLKKELFTPDDPNMNAKVGALTTAFMVAYMLLSPVFGWLADRMSRWWLVGGAVLVWSLASGASGLATTYLIMFLTRCVVGVGEAAYGPVAPTLISDLYPVKKRGWVLAWFYAAIPVGSALGFVLGGFMAGQEDAGLGWRWAFYLVVPPGVLLAMWCFFMPEPGRGLADNAAGHSHGNAGWRQYSVLWKTPSYVLCCAGMTASTFAIGGIAVWMPEYVSEFRRAGELDEVNAIFGAILVVSGLAATLVGGWLGDRLRQRYPGSYFLVSGGGMLVAFPCFIAALYTPFWFAWVWIFLAIFCLFLNTGPANTILANVTHPAIRATGFALNIFIIHVLGDAISPAIIGGINDLTRAEGDPLGDMNVGFLVVSSMILLSGILWIWGAQYLQRDTELAPRRLNTQAEPASAV